MTSWDTIVFLVFFAFFMVIIIELAEIKRSIEKLAAVRCQDEAH